MRVTILVAGALLVLAACNTAPVLPPEDDRTIELVETQLWSGGEVRAVVRHAEAEETPVAITLDGEVLAVARVDDTTFSATLPVRTGTLPIRVVREGLDPVDRSVTLHGYLGVTLGPPVEGHIVVIGGSAARVLGGTRDGLVEVSLAAATTVRHWPATLHDHDCGWGVLPGLETGQVILRGRNSVDCNAPVVARLGLDIAIESTLPANTWYAPTAVLGPGVVLAGGYDLRAQQGRCDNEFVGCTWSESVPRNHSLFGMEVSPALSRAVTLANRPALYDTRTGDTVRSMPWIDPLASATGVAFDLPPGRLYVSSATPGGTRGGLHAVRASDGEVTAAFTDLGMGFLGVTVDPVRNLVLAAAWNVAASRLELRAFRRSSLEPVAVLPMDDAVLAVRLRNGTVRVVADAPGGVVYVVGALSFSANPATGHEAMVIARWSLP